jgi:2-amino-4-hydroxy-6-hydroxymethyldihydropteridine diphosphokinase
MTVTGRLAYVGLGANLGDSRANVHAAAARVAGLPGVTACRLSSLYETAPWGKTDQPWFVNAVAELRVALAPGDLLETLLRIELDLGRVRQERWGPRTIDLDYLLD